LSKDTKRLLTRYVHEKQWVPTRREDALRMITEEMPQTDAEATLRYIESEIRRGKTVTLGTCGFRLDKD
jgi:hypothetical protein